MSVSLELPQEPYIILEEPADVLDVVFAHGEAFDA